MPDESLSATGVAVAHPVSMLEETSNGAKTFSSSGLVYVT